MSTSLDPSAVLDALIRACSQDAQVLKPAEQQLKSWESQPGFYSILASVFLKHDLDVSVRWLAVLYFKNGIDRYWRRNAPSAISEEEKSTLRSRFIASFNEPVVQIATQLSVLIGKIARLDCPRYWPELIPVLLDAVRVNDLLCQHRALLVFYHVVLSLASRRCEGEVRVFEELTSNVFSFMFLMWETNNDDFFSALQNRDSFGAGVALDRSILVLKVLRQLIRYGFSELVKNASAMDFMRLVLQRLDHFLKAKPLLESLSHELLPKREKIITTLSKVLYDVQDKHSEGFVEFLRPSLEMAALYNFTDQGSGLIFERFTVFALNLTQSILRCDVYRPAKTIAETKNPVTLLAHRIKTEFFTDEVLVTLCRHLVLHYFVLTQDDLVCWESDPESFMSEESGDSWKFSMRPCTENLFRTFVKEFSGPLLPLLIEMLHENKSSINPNDLSAVLRKDAVYCALGEASFDLYELVNFDELFLDNLLPELQVKHPNYRIIQRRVIWLIGCWVGVKLSNSLRAKLYESVIPFLDQSQDLVVRIEAALTLKSAIDVFEFSTQQFLPYLDVCFAKLLLLLKDVSECETKMTILHVMSYIIERMQADIRPHVGLLLQYLPMLWDASAEHNMLRCAILTTLTQLVQGLGSLCVGMFDLLLPVIRLSTDVTQPPHIYLYEDGLELWSNTIQCSPSATPQLLDLFSNMGPLLELGTESLQVCLKVIDAYIVLAPTEFFQQYYSSLATSLTSLLKHVNAEATVMIYKVIERVVTVFPEDGPAVFSSVFFDVFQAIVESDQIESPTMTMMQLVLFSRVILHSPQFFWSFVRKLAKQFGRSNSEVVEMFYDNISEKMSFVVRPARKKLCAMALLSLLNNSASHSRFTAIVTFCVDTFHEIGTSNLENGVKTDCFVMPSCDLQSDEEPDTEHEKRRHALALQDPTYAVSLRDFLLSRLTNLQTEVGSTTFTSLVETLDCEIYQQLQEFLR